MPLMTMNSNLSLFPNATSTISQFRTVYFFTIAFFSLYLFGGKLMAQNLVPNPSFENLKESPCSSHDTKFEFENSIFDWYAPNLGTTDVYSVGLSPACPMNLPTSTAPLTSWVPRGDQLPRTGNHMIGFKPYIDYRREYAAVKLSCKLVPGKEYYAEMYVSLSEQTNFAQNNIGMYFSETRIFRNSFDYLNLDPQIVETDIISDSVSWVKISGTFTASNQAEYLIIGCFTSKSENATLYLGDKGDIDFAYYFFDDVLVEAVDNTPATITVTGDTTLCAGETLNLSASGASNISWYNSAGNLVSSGPMLSSLPTTSTTYQARSVGCNNESTVTKQIVVYTPIPKDLGNDTTVCPGATVELSALNHTHHEWMFNGQSAGSTSSILADQPGLYELQARDVNNCIIRDAIRIGVYQDPTPVANLGVDKYTCETTGKLQLDLVQNMTCVWQDGSTSSSFAYNGPGEFYVTVSNYCGTSASDTIVITAVDLFIPNLMTVNGDNKNDVFEILGGETGEGSLSIYSRFGASIFEDASYENNWKADTIVEGLYYYEYLYPGCDPKKGWVQIMK